MIEWFKENEVFWKRSVKVSVFSLHHMCEIVSEGLGLRLGFRVSAVSHINIVKNFNVRLIKKKKQKLEFTFTQFELLSMQ